MKTIGLGTVVVCVAAGCGGSDNSTIPDGSTDGTVGDTGSNDGSNDASNDVSNNDSGGDSGSDAGPFNPANVPNLVLWLEGDVSSSITTATNDAGIAKVTKWADQTSHHNDATGTAGNPARNPHVKSSAINSLSAIHFDQQPLLTQGNMLTIIDNADTSLRWGTGDFFLAVVADFDNATGTNASPNLQLGNFYSKEGFTSGIGAAPPPPVYAGVVFLGNALGNPPGPGLFFGTANTSGDSVTTATAYNTGAAHLFVLRRRAAKIDLFVDNGNVATATTTNPDVSDPTTVVRIGADGDANQARLDGDIGEMLAVKGALSLSDEANLVGYLRTKWATP